MVGLELQSCQLCNTSTAIRTCLLIEVRILDHSREPNECYNSVQADVVRSVGLKTGPNKASKSGKIAAPESEQRKKRS